MKMKKKGFAAGGMKKKGFAAGGMKKKGFAAGGKLTKPSLDKLLKDKKSITQMPGSSKRQRPDNELTRATEKRLMDESNAVIDKKNREEDRMNMPSMMKKGGNVKKMKAGGMTKKGYAAGGMTKKMKAGGGIAKKGKAKGGKAKGGKSKVRGAGIAQRGVRPAKMR